MSIPVSCFLVKQSRQRQGCTCSMLALGGAGHVWQRRGFRPRIRCDALFQLSALDNDCAHAAVVRQELDLQAVSGLDAVRQCKGLPPLQRVLVLAFVPAAEQSCGSTPSSTYG